MIDKINDSHSFIPLPEGSNIFKRMSEYKEREQFGKFEIYRKRNITMKLNEVILNDRDDIIFHFRNADSVLKFDELKNLEIYFCPYNSEDDAAEGLMNVYWKADGYCGIISLRSILLFSMSTIQ